MSFPDVILEFGGRISYNMLDRVYEILLERYLSGFSDGSRGVLFSNVMMNHFTKLGAFWNNVALSYVLYLRGEMGFF